MVPAALAVVVAAVVQPLAQVFAAEEWRLAEVPVESAAVAVAVEWQPALAAEGGAWRQVELEAGLAVTAAAAV